MALNPTPGSWDGVSIPDLVEDKQRHRAAVLNASLKLVKFSQMPSYIFDSNKVDATNIAKTEFGNIIPSNGDANTAVALMQKDQVKSDVSWILDQIDSMAQRSTATPDMQQGVVSKQQRTLGELNMVSNKVDSRYSLTARIFSGAFERFWNIWYLNYKEYFAKEIDKKVIRIS